jgi:hypothetical protein
MNQPQIDLRLLFARQEKEHLAVACILILSAPDGTTPDEALSALKEATAAWFDAESPNALTCQRYAGIDANIGDLGAHGAFKDPDFEAALAKRNIKFKDLEFLDFDLALPYDTPLFEARDEEVVG